MKKIFDWLWGKKLVFCNGYPGYPNTFKFIETAVSLSSNQVQRLSTMEQMICSENPKALDDQDEVQFCSCRIAKLQAEADQKPKRSFKPPGEAQNFSFFFASPHWVIPLFLAWPFFVVVGNSGAATTTDYSDSNQ